MPRKLLPGISCVCFFFVAADFLANDGPSPDLLPVGVVALVDISSQVLQFIRDAEW
jgi:hypothetical protein